MLLKNKLSQFKLILGSQSPRRQLLMRELGLIYNVLLPEEFDESYPSNLLTKEIPIFLSEKKANYFANLENDTILITADTIVDFQGKVLGKPTNRENAIEMISLLSGNQHIVYTGVTFKNRSNMHSFLSESKVYFRKLYYEEIVYYVDHFKPFDKAGAYGAQDWIGLVGIEKIEGSYFNVMGLPVHQLYVELNHFLDKIFLNVE